MTFQKDFNQNSEPFFISCCNYTSPNQTNVHHKQIQLIAQARDLMTWCKRGVAKTPYYLDWTEEIEASCLRKLFWSSDRIVPISSSEHLSGHV